MALSIIVSSIVTLLSMTAQDPTHTIVLAILGAFLYEKIAELVGLRTTKELKRQTKDFIEKEAAEKPEVQL
ncbi:MAG: hypothetical protein ACXAEU_04890 [Candidatus Hodarchaeales archaeon]